VSRDRSAIVGDYRIRTTPVGAEKPGPSASFCDDHVLAMPSQNRETEMATRRAAALTVCGHAVRHGDDPLAALEDLRALGLVADPYSVERTHFGKPRGDEAG
jgi:hypothetical protein